MSIEILDSLKKQTTTLSPQEKKQLAQYLLEQTEQNESKDLGLSGETGE